ncbi:MAG: thermonuclease family protein [Gammaproteobacteria bacterium]|nr:MAG: thermonuclease family protein [Gammaproteobacteria bacterium]
MPVPAALPPGASTPIRLALAACLLFALACPAAGRALCPADRFDAQARVRYVDDGDTLTLEDGRRVRLIGLNAPEIPHRDRPGEPGGIEARNRLRALVDASGRRVRLRFDAERRDRHGRLLAHVFDRNGRLLSALLIDSGLAFAVTIPPNLWQADCLHRLDRQAQRARRGLWGRAAWAPLEADRPADFRRLRPGFRRLRGRVRNVTRFRRGTRVRLSHLAQLWIPARYRRYFSGDPPARWRGRRIEARGWMHPWHGRWELTLTHPLNLRRLP